MFRVVIFNIYISFGTRFTIKSPQNRYINPRVDCMLNITVFLVYDRMRTTLTKKMKRAHKVSIQWIHKIEFYRSFHRAQVGL